MRISHRAIGFYFEGSNYNTFIKFGMIEKAKKKKRQNLAFSKFDIRGLLQALTLDLLGLIEFVHAG
jgi:hypothetical protein